MDEQLNRKACDSVGYIVLFFYVGSRIYFNGSGAIPDYFQLLNVNISDTVGLLCLGENTSTTIHWILPDNTILPNNATTTAANATVIMFTRSSLGLFSLNGPGTLSLTGVYVCVVQFQDGHIEKQHVWITNGKDDVIYITQF